MKAEILIKNAANLGEGPVWDDIGQKLYFVDIDDCFICIYNLENGDLKKIKTPGRVGMLTLCEDTDTVLCAVENGICLYNTKNEIFAPYITDIFDPDGGVIRFNDGKCDRMGRLYVGSLDFSGKKRSSLYCVHNKKIEVCDMGVDISNGIVFSRDEKYLYFCDTGADYIYRFDYNIENGELTNKTPHISAAGQAGGFDGMTSDEGGLLYVARWGGSCVQIIDPETKEQKGKINIPAPNVTSAEFGGSELDTLFITCAGGTNLSMLQEYPLAGSVFSIKTGTKGVRTNRFKL